VRYTLGDAIITPLHPLSGIRCPVISTPTVAARTGCGLPPRTHRYLLTGLALATLVPVRSAAAQTVSEVQITPETMTIGVGQKQALFVTAFDQRGNLIPAAKFSFWSSDTLVAEVRKDGTVVGVNPGLAKIEARSQGKRASMAVLITGAARGPVVGSVLTLEPASVTLLPGETVRIVPQALREDGGPAPLGRVSWKSLKPEVASVDSVGLIGGVAPGRAIVQVTAGSRLMATLPVEVAQADFALAPSKLALGPDDADTVRVLVPSQGNRELRGLVQWRSTDTTVASVSPSGVVRAHNPGQAEIIASGASQERRASVAVHRLPDALVVSPHQGAIAVQVPLRSTRQFTAVAEAADSSPIPEALVVWHLSDTSLAVFDPATGVLTPKTLGTATLTATLAGITPAVWTIQIVPGDIALEPDRVGLLVGQRTTLTASLRSDLGASTNKAAGTHWSSDRPEVAIAREGIVDALSPGHAVITATTPWGKSATGDVFVTGDLVLTSNRGGNYGIYQMRVSGPAGLLPVLADSATNIQAVLSPDRTQIAFSSDRGGGNYDIYLTDADGRNLKRLTSTPGNEGEPAWTPDGKRIVYTSTTGTATQIALVSLDGNDHRQLTMGPSRNSSPSVSPDGRSIAFVSTRDGNQEIYTMGLDGSSQRRITKSSVRESNPRFFPSGDLLYVTERGGKSKGSRVLRQSAGGTPVLLIQTDQPIASLALSRDADRLVYVVARLADAAKGRVEFNLFLQSTAVGSQPVLVPLRPGEQILNPSF
jgi:Tol biopolymer transport system component